MVFNRYGGSSMKKIVEEKISPKTFKDLGVSESIKLIAEEMEVDVDDVEYEDDELDDDETDDLDEEIVSFTEDGFRAFCDHVQEEWTEDSGYEDIDILYGLVADAAKERVGEPMDRDDVIEITASEEAGEPEEDQDLESMEADEEDEEPTDETFEFECNEKY